MKLEKEIKSKDIENIRVKALLEILFTASFINNKHSKFLQPFKISPQQYNILRILRGSFPEKINIQTIKERMLEKTPNTTRMIDKLYDNQYVERERSEEDRRMVFVRISPKGLHIMSEIDKIHPEYLKFTYKWSDQDAFLVSDLMEKLRE
ncbi:MAG: MarR family transcriptional regulator [Candidatus Cyclobacteriaceae bacterium M3_2C_046]